jgi:hypothetical protein
MNIATILQKYEGGEPGSKKAGEDAEYPFPDSLLTLRLFPCLMNNDQESASKGESVKEDFALPKTILPAPVGCNGRFSTIAGMFRPSLKAFNLSHTGPRR